MSSQPPSRHDRRKQETRDRIREAAVDLFASQGYEGTKVAEICEQADVARQTFFNHFPAKRDLLAELFDIGVDFMEAMMDAVCERGATTRERLSLFFCDIVGAAVDVGPFNRDLVAHVVQASDDEQRIEQAQQISNVFLTLVRRGLETGDVTRRHAPEVLAEMTEGALVILMRDWATRGRFDPLERAAQLADLIADAIEKRPDEA